VKKALDDQWKRLNFGAVSPSIALSPPSLTAVMSRWFLRWCPTCPSRRKRSKRSSSSSSSTSVLRSAASSGRASLLILRWWTTSASQTSFSTRPPPPLCPTRTKRCKRASGTDCPRLTRLRNKIEKVFATYGARGVLTGGPLQDLQSAIYRNMRPYNPSMSSPSISLHPSQHHRYRADPPCWH
jgi:hypothetical protein